MDFHEVTKLFPEMTSAEFHELASDMAKRGLVEPIWTYQGQIIDGRHRFRVCCNLAIATRFQEWAGEGGSLVGFVASRNLHRRHLTPSQRATIAVEIKTILDEEIKQELREKQRQAGKDAHRGKRKEKVSTKIGKDLSPNRNAQQEAAKIAGVSHGYVSDAERIKEKSPETFEDVKNGRKTIQQAKRQLNGPPAAKPSGNPKPEPKPDADNARAPVEYPLFAACEPETEDYDLVLGQQMAELASHIESKFTATRESHRWFFAEELRAIADRYRERCGWKNVRTVEVWSGDEAGAPEESPPEVPATVPPGPVLIPGSAYAAEPIKTDDDIRYLESVSSLGKRMPGAEYEGDALLYRAVQPYLAALKAAIDRVVPGCSAGCGGPLLRMVRDLVSVSDPRFWIPCSRCESKGRVDGLCRKCRGFGYQVISPS